MLRALRMVAVLHALCLLAQPILAGLFLSGHDSLIDAHANNASVVVGLALVQAVLCAQALRKKLIPPLILAEALGLLLCEGVQMAMGYQHSLWLHIPLGTVLLAATAVLLAQLRPSSVPGPGGSTTTNPATIAEVAK